MVMTSPKALVQVGQFALSMVVGWVAYLVAASAIGLIQPIWWGGAALIFPVIAGVAFIVLGVFPLYAVARGLMNGIGHAISTLGILTIGFLVGFGFLPISDLLGMMLRPWDAWGSLDPWIAVVLSLAISGWACVVLAAVLVAGISKVAASQRT